MLRSGVYTEENLDFRWSRIGWILWSFFWCWSGSNLEFSAKWRNFRRRCNLFSVIICEKYGVTLLSLLEKYIPFSGFCTIPWWMRSPIRVFISFEFVTIQLLAWDHGFKLGFATKNWLAYIYVCSANNCHISSSVNFWKHSRTLISSSKSTFTPLTPRNANLGRVTPWGTKHCKKSDTSSYGSLYAQCCLYPNLCLNLPHLYQTKNHQIPQRIHHFRLQFLKLWRYRHLSADPSFACYYTLPFISL